MDIADVRRLAAAGVAKFPPKDLGSLSDWLRDFGDATGEARYSALANVVALVNDQFEQRSGQMFTVTVEQIDRHLQTAIPTILDASDLAYASGQARSLLDEVALTLQGDGR